MKINFADAIKKDQLLVSIALYEVTKGMLVIAASADEVLETQKQIAKKFNYFKKQIQCGETTLEDLSEAIAYKNGAFKQNNIKIDKIAEEIGNDGAKADREKMSNEGAKRLIQTIFEKNMDKSIVKNCNSVVNKRNNNV